MLSESGSYKQFSDGELIKMIQESDEQAFEEFRRRHWKFIFGLCHKILWGREEARDVAEDAFIKLWVKRHQCNANWNPKGWVCTIAVNACVDVLRKRRHEAIDSDMEDFDSREDPDPSPEENAIKTDLNGIMLPCFKDLDEQELRVVIMIYLADANPNRVSKALGIRYKEVQNIHRSAIAKLRKCMEVSHHD